MSDIDHDTWNKARDHTKRMISQDIYELFNRDKFDFLQTLFSASHKQGGPEWDGYAEGVRHALLIMKSRSDPEDTYNQIINRTMPKIQVEDEYGRVWTKTLLTPEEKASSIEEAKANRARFNRKPRILNARQFFQS